MIRANGQKILLKTYLPESTKKRAEYLRALQKKEPIQSSLKLDICLGKRHPKKTPSQKTSS